MKRESDKNKVKEIIETHLSKLVDPGAGLDVMRLGLIHNLSVHDEGVSLTFRPSSPVCPMAFSLAPKVQAVIESVTGMDVVTINVENFNRAEELEALLNR